MKILQIGSGSMGTRRLRDLHRRKEVTLGVLDHREDRRARAKSRFNVPVFGELEAAMDWQPEAIVVSTPPGTKGDYVRLALERGLHHFCEADIWTYDVGAIERISRAKRLVSAPSASFMFLPIVRELQQLIPRHAGAVLGYQFFLSSYMPGWHPDEGPEFYGRHRNTAPSREMICFELHWLNSLFSPAGIVAGRYEKFGQLPDQMEDTWSLSMRLQGGGVGQLTITMACPCEFRRGICFGSEGLLSWDIREGTVDPCGKEPTTRRLDFGRVTTVIEASYFEEINLFVDAAQGKKAWPYDYSLALQSSATLAAAERSFATQEWEAVDLQCQPETLAPLR